MNIKLADLFDQSDEIRPEYLSAYISLWDHWLDRDEFYKLGEVTATQCHGFNILLSSIFKSFSLYVIDWNDNTLKPVVDIDSYLIDSEEYANTASLAPKQIVIADLEAVLEVSHDYTFIIRYKSKERLDKLTAIIKQAGLFVFLD